LSRGELNDGRRRGSKRRNDFGECDLKRDAAVQFARKVIERRGRVTDADLNAVRDGGYTDANVMEIVALVAMYSLTNFFNNVFDPEKDFPAVAPAGSI
jgi:alkylhydroperoxidase family enzyme